MQKQSYLPHILLLGSCLILTLSHCSATGSSSSDDTSSSSLSDESNIEASTSSAVEAFIESANSSTSSSSSSASTSLSSSISTKALSNGRNRFYCADPTDAQESYACTNSTGIMTRDITFDDCAITHGNRNFTLNGEFSNSVTHGGSGFCGVDKINFSHMVMGNDEGDAVHTHDTGDDGMVKTFTNIKGHSVTITKNVSRTVTFTNPVDLDEDGSAEEVTATIAKNITRTRVINSNTVHDIHVFTSNESFDSTDDENSVTTISPSLPNHRLEIDESGEIETRTIASGELIVDHNSAKIRMVFGVGDNGLVFDSTTDCGPSSGSMTYTAYTINDDGSIGAVLGTGTTTFIDGEVDSSTYNGAAITLRDHTCS